MGGSTLPGNLTPDIASLVESFDGGATWNDLTPPISATPYQALAISSYQGPFVADPRFTQVTDIGANTYDPNTIYITNGTNIYVTKDGGKSWVEADTGITGLGNIYKLVVDPTNRDHVYAIFNDLFGNQVFESTDAGQSWNDISFNLPQLPAWSLAIDSRDGDVYIGLDEGVWVLPSGSTTWQQFGAGMPNVQVRSLQLNVTTNTLLAGTYGRGVYQILLNDGSADAGGLQAVSGNSVWTGPVILEGSVSGNTVTVGANGTQVLKNGLATASLNIVGPISDLSAGNPAAPAQDRPGQRHPVGHRHLQRRHRGAAGLPHRQQPAGAGQHHRRHRGRCRRGAGASVERRRRAADPQRRRPGAAGGLQQPRHRLAGKPQQHQHLQRPHHAGHQRHHRRR